MPDETVQQLVKLLLSHDDDGSVMKIAMIVMLELLTTQSWIPRLRFIARNMSTTTAMVHDSATMLMPMLVLLTVVEPMTCILASPIGMTVIIVMVMVLRSRFSRRTDIQGCSAVLTDHRWQPSQPGSKTACENQWTRDLDMARRKTFSEYAAFLSWCMLLSP